MKQDSLTTATTTRVLKPTQDSSSVSLLNIDSASLPTPLEEAHACTAELSFNIAENTAKPKGYQGMNYRNAPRQTMENQTIHPDDQTIITSQPMPGESNTLATFRDGWAECMFTGYVKKQILGFAIRLSVRRNRYRGLGMFAARGMKTGDLILDERPMLVAPVLSDPRTIAFPENFTKDQILQAAIYEYEKTLGFCFRCMPKENQQAFMELTNCHQRDGSGTPFGIIRTNEYEVEGLKDKNAQEPFGIYTAVWDKLSRLNHRRLMMEEEGVQTNLYYKVTLYQLATLSLMYGRKLAAISRARKFEEAEQTAAVGAVRKTGGTSGLSLISFPQN
ncbi:hypothetical protein EV421DRAFT_1742663 [Armillaria borealis]|uniref:SET domain-containing protein n=1 Tax=Armillaria borealis TaxID=47425 RepID=A0AA39IYJ8_9AGAR|nr:hypothetical protein EV421DRAFT_1742663 [Armillaria borealis]